MIADRNRRLALQPALAAALTLLVVAGFVSVVHADEITVRRDADDVYLRFRLDHVLEDEVLESLRSGLPSRVRQLLQIWQRRSTFWDRQVVEVLREYRVVYDLIDETYDLFDEEGLYESNLDRPELEERLSHAPFAPLCPRERLRGGKSYYAVVEVVVEPLSIEEVRDLERWLKGTLRDGEGGGGLGRLSSHLVGIFKSRVGLGERRHEAKSSVFDPDDLRRLGTDD